MSLRAALVALHHDPELAATIEDMPVSDEKIAILAGLIEAINRDLVTVREDDGYELSGAARRMVECPVRAA